MKKLAAILTIIMIVAAGTAMAIKVEDVGIGTSGTGLTYFEIPKDVVLFNTTGASIHEPSIIYTYSIKKQDPGRAVITDNNNVSEGVKKGVDGLVKIQGSDYGGYTGTAGTDPVNLVFSDAFTLKDTNQEGSQVLKTSKVATRRMKVSFHVEALKDSEGQYKSDTAGIYRYIIEDTTTPAALAAAGIKRNGNYDKTRFLDVYVEWADDNHTTPQVYGYVLYKPHDSSNTANGNSSFEYNNGKTTYLKVTGYNVESEMRSTDGNSNPTSDEYHTYNLKVTKTVDGEANDKNHPFPISVELTNTTVLNNRIIFHSTGTFASSQLIMGEGACHINEDYNESGPKLKDGESFTMIGLPEGTKFVINEQNDTGSEYSVTIRDETQDLNLTDTSGVTVSGGAETTLTNANEMTNQKNGAYEAEDIQILNKAINMAAPTAYESRHAPYILMMIFGVIAIVLAGAGIARKKRVLGAEAWVQAKGPPGKRGDPGL